MTWVIQAAFDHASLILSWQENLPKEEAPPPGIWSSDDAITEWFDTVDVRRQTQHHNADITGWEVPDDDEFEENELARQAKKKMGLK